MKKKTIGGFLLVAVLILAVAIPLCVVNIHAEEPPATPMKISDDMMTLLKKLEGFNPHAYWDYKQWSIGYGSKCPEDKIYYYRADGEGNQISEEYADELLRSELVEFEEAVNKFITQHNLTLAQHQYDALVSFTYNVGPRWTTTPTGNLPTAIIQGDNASAMLYGLMLYSMAGEEHILIKRRTVEMNVYANGIYNIDEMPERYRIAFMDANGGVIKYDEHGFDAEDPTPIRTLIESAPTGPDETGALVTYELDGWYTEREGGTKVELLDASIPTGTMLYAHWKTPSGTPVVIPQPDTGLELTIRMTTSGVNIRTGPGTYYASLGTANKGDTFEITNILSRGGYYWGRFGDNWICLDTTTYKKDYTTYKALRDEMLPLSVKVASATMEVRKSPSMSSDAVEGATKRWGDVVEITDWKSDGTQMWGQTAEGWIPLPQVALDPLVSPPPVPQAIELHQKPDKLTYVQMSEALDVTGGKLLVTYTDDSTQLVDITDAMVSGFDNSNPGINTLTVTYEGFTVNLDVEIIKAKVIFLMDDGTVISETEYLYGDTVQVPDPPTKPTDSNGYYVFAGWGKEVTTCAGNAVYQAVFELWELVGDLNGDLIINDRDAVYLLGYTLFPDDYPAEGTIDLNGDGVVNDRDAVYLLGYTLFPDDYPLPKVQLVHNEGDR